MKTYIYELPDWPNFIWRTELLAELLAQVRYRQGKLLGRMEGLGFHSREEALLNVLTEDVIKSSEIEGEVLNRESVRSSIARRLGIEIGALIPADRYVEGVVEMMLDATQNYSTPLTAERLFAWHASLFPTGRSGLSRIKVGSWRDDAHGPMQVISGPIGKEKVHFQAPPAKVLNAEMNKFLDWFEGDPGEPVIKAALAHLWFVTLHPFDDGNGRIARAIADMMLARSEKSNQRFYSMSAQIRIERNAYYDRLETTQSHGMDVTSWLEWFLGCLSRAIQGANKITNSALQKARFWEKHKVVPFNDRQKNILGLLLDGTFEGALTSSKWAKINKCSQDTAGRDIDALIQVGVLKRHMAGGRSTRYLLSDED